MVLETGLEPLSAKWENNQWQIGQKEKFRWCHTNNDVPASEWFYDFNDALNWIKEQNK
jgi:hypothetical protein